MKGRVCSTVIDYRETLRPSVTYSLRLTAGHIVFSNSSLTYNGQFSVASWYKLSQNKGCGRCAEDAGERYRSCQKGWQGPVSFALIELIGKGSFGRVHNGWAQLQFFLCDCHSYRHLFLILYTYLSVPSIITL
jgi:hypothetical protein